MWTCVSITLKIQYHLSLEGYKPEFDSTYLNVDVIYLKNFVSQRLISV